MACTRRDDSARTRRKILISTQVEQLAIDTGAYRNDGGCDVLLTSDAPRGCDATLTEDDPRRAQIGPSSKPLGEAMRSIKTSYHFVAAADEGWSLEPYRCGVGGHEVVRRFYGAHRLAERLRTRTNPRAPRVVLC